MSEIKYERNTNIVINRARVTSIATLCASPHENSPKEVFSANKPND